ncbi:MAG: glycosyltransferase family 4 protein [Candidatus Eisenbacteria bacterium]|uniref:Glycosyltransferase family 4 protein n=1 Tax=Eiseniibacteriota bacterium TaxID=2212470 RepID=A0A538UBF4_UNCEI|nr:MAG: glycosyltransferase family 4 protein [Candidatus Eisenbacteria bacterium]
MSAPIRVVHLSSVHDAHDVRIFHRECRSLAEAGYDVVLVAPHDADETSRGVKILAVPRPKGRWERATRTAWRVFRKGLAAHGAVYHLHDPELLQLLGKRVIYDAHENVPKDVLTKHYLPRAARAALAVVADLAERAACAPLDGAIGVTPGIARRFPRTRRALVRNYPRVEELALPGAQPYAVRRPIVAYVGGLSAIRGVREMVRAIGRVDPALGAELRLAGRLDPPELERGLESEPGWSRTVRLGWQTREQVASLLGTARVGLLVLHPAPNHLDSLPIKLFEYMSAGLPVVASDFAAWRSMVSDAGLWVDPLDPSAIAAAIERLLTRPEEAERMGRRGREAVRARFPWEGEARTLAALYRRIAGPPDGRTAS